MKLIDTQYNQKGWTLIELVMVIAIIGILSAIAIRSITNTLENARFNITAKEMDRIEWATVGNPDLITTFGRTDYGYVGDTGQLPPNLDALLTDPGGVCGWDGPYISVDFDENPDDYKLDGWANPYTFTVDAIGQIQIISDSAGTKTIDDTSHILYNTVQVQLFNSDGVPLDDLSGDISVEYGCGWTPLTFNENTGKFVINTVPIGQRLVRGVASGDTTYKTLGVVPGSNSSLEMTVYPKFGTISSEGCGTISGTGNYIVSEQVNNNGSPTYLIDKITITFEDGPCWGCENAYLDKIVVGPVTYWDYTTVGSRVGSGTQVILDQILYIYSGLTTIDLYFNNATTGSGYSIDMSATTMSLKFYPTNAPTRLISFVACGTGCTTPALTFVGGSGSVTGSESQIVNFQVQNSGVLPLSFDAVSILNPTWTAPGSGTCWECGTAYLTDLTSGGQTYWSYSDEGNGTRASSGATLNFRQTLYIAGGDATSFIMTFNNANTGTGAPINMSFVDFIMPFYSNCDDFGPTQTISFTASGGAVACSACLLSYVSHYNSGTPRPKDVEVSLSNSGDPCTITTIKITSSLTTSLYQPYVYKVRDDLTDRWTALENGGVRASTIAGSETIMSLSPPIVLSQADAIIDVFEFQRADNSTINMAGAELVISLGLDCCDCISPQNISFTVE